MSHASNHLAWQQRVHREKVDARNFFTSNTNFFTPSKKDFFSSTRLMSPEANAARFSLASQREGGLDAVGMRSFHKEQQT